MSENLFDAAYYFEKVFRESKEFKGLQQLCHEINTDPEAKLLLNHINHLNSQLQQKQMMGQEIKQQEAEALQKMELAVQQNEKLKRMLEADYQVNMLLMELNKIISKPLEDLYNQVLGGKK
ncbi:YlbF family regulator [Niallia oryzisoli]|uniref:YlbF family regulator n=1 Tax=Niallia oryzisoli TaxID=1737571 RepID=UPI0037352765